MEAVLSLPLWQLYHHHIGFEILTACLGLVKKRQQVSFEAIYRNSGIKGYCLS